MVAILDQIAERGLYCGAWGAQARFTAHGRGDPEHESDGEVNGDVSLARAAPGAGSSDGNASGFAMTSWKQRYVT